jgi:hypothetical protein
MSITLGKIESLQTLGIEFDCDHQIHPLPIFRQVLWFHLSGQDMHGRIHCHTCYWLEAQDGHLWAIEIQDLFGVPNDHLPQLAAALATTKNKSDFPGQLERAWLFPPDFTCRVLDSQMVIPLKLNIQETLFNFLGILGFDPELVIEGNLPLEEFKMELDELPLPAEVLPLGSKALAFRSRLNSDVLQMLDCYAHNQGRNDSIDNYNLCTQWPHPLHRYRVQALRTFPWLWPDFGLAVQGADIHVRNLPLQTLGNSYIQHESTRLAVDRGLELIPTLAKRYGVSKSTVRHVRSLLTSRTIDTSLIAPLMLLTDAIKPNKRQSSQEELGALVSVVEWLMGIGLSDDQRFIRGIATTLFADGVNEGYTRLARWCPSHRYGPFHDSGDFLNALREHAGTTSLRIQTSADILRTWLKWADIRSYFQASERWHRYAMQIDDGFAEVDWVPCLQSPTTFGQRRAYELHSSAMLAEEGIAMHHCVGTFWRRCASGSSIIFSLRSHENMSKSTLEIKIDLEQGVFINQHRGFGNSMPARECEESAQLLLEYISDNALHVASERMSKFNQEVEDVQEVVQHADMMGFALRHAMENPDLAALRTAMKL